jgi:hypothetical protein
LRRFRAPHLFSGSPWGRAPDRDEGSSELILRKVMAQVPRSNLTDIALAAHEKISREELVTLRQLADWFRALASAYGIGRQRAGRHLGASDPGRSLADRAAFRPAELHRHFGRLRLLDQLSLMMRIANAAEWIKCGSARSSGCRNRR